MGPASTIRYRKRASRSPQGLVLFDAVVMSCTAEDSRIALGERLLGAIWIVSGLIVLALTIATALQNGDYEHLNPQPALS